jgi:PadR family transcriptional regulator PadR
MSKPESSLFPHGTLDLAILRTLDSMGALHGYAIARRLEQLAGGATLSQGAVYPALMRLEQERLIKAKWGLSETDRRVKFYSLTAAGTKRLQREVATWKQSVSLLARLLEDEA